MDSAVAQIELAVKACPNQRLVLAGYSQGAWVLGDVLGRLSLQAQQRIAAVALFGDPLFVRSPPTTVGGAPSRVGVLATQAPRTPYIPARFGALTRSYCRIHDPVCNYQKRYLALCSLPFNLGSACEHFHYADAGEEVDDAAVFVVAKLRRPVTASAGWPQLHYSADHTGYSPAERVLNPTTGALRWRVDLPMPVDPGVTVANGLVYTLDQYGNGLYAFDAATGALRWRRAGLGSFRSVPAVTDGLLYQVSGGELVAVDAATGAIVWRSPGPTGTAAGAGTDSSPAVANGVVYAAWPGTATDGGVFAFDARTGAKLWHGPPTTVDRPSASSSRRRPRSATGRSTNSPFLQRHDRQRRLTSTWQVSERVIGDPC